MNLYIYCDESGVFDKKNGKFYIIAGYLFLDIKKRDNSARKYLSIEKTIKKKLMITDDIELKGSYLKRDYKNKKRLLNSLNGELRFAILIDLEKTNNNIFSHKLHKQRFLDYAFSRSLKEFFIHISNKKIIDLSKIENIMINMDQRPTASSGVYDLKTSLLKELHIGKFSYNFSKFRSGILNNLKDVKLKYLDSKNNLLIRASDILANFIFFKINSNKQSDIKNITNLFVIELP